MCLNWPGELHSDAELISGDQAAAYPLVTTAAQLSTTEATTKLTAFLVVKANRNHASSLFIPLMFGTRNDHISSTAWGCKTPGWIKPQMSQVSKSRSPSDSALGREHYPQTLKSPAATCKSGSEHPSWWRTIESESFSARERGKRENNWYGQI